MSDTNKKQPKAKHFHIASKDRDYFTTNLALLLRAAVPVGEAISSLQEGGRTRVFQQAMQQLNRDIAEGMPLWHALERSGLSSGQSLALIKMGEQSGNLVENMQVAAQQEEKQRIFQSKIRSALLYPGFVLGLTGVVGLAVAWFLLPRLSETFSQLGVDLPLISRIFIGFGVFLKENGLWAVPAILAISACILYVLFGLPATRGIGRRLLFRLPGVGKLLYEVEIARFGYLLGTLLQAGLSVTQALELLQESTTSPKHRRLYGLLRDGFNDGYSFKASLGIHHKLARKLLPAAIQQMVAAAERSGSLPETLRTVGTIYEEKSDVSTKNLETVLEPILLLIVAAGVMLVAIAVIMPIYGLLGGLGGVQ